MPSFRNAVELLSRYHPSNRVETDDVARIRTLAAEASDPWSRTLPLHLTASAVIVHPPTAQVLLRWHPKMGSWLQIGGHGDPGDPDPLAVALREGAEETGLPDLRPWPDGAVRHVVVVPVSETPREAAHEHADLRFVLATETPDAARPEQPAAPLRWLSITEAYQQVDEDNLRETLSRVESLLVRGSLGHS